MFENIEIKKKNGNEIFENMNNSNEMQLIDFWKWEHSDIIGNSERGILAEYIVAAALNVKNMCRREWDAYDVLSKDGIKIEVKLQHISRLGIKKSVQKLSLVLGQQRHMIMLLILMIRKLKDRQIFMFSVFINIRMKKLLIL